MKKRVLVTGAGIVSAIGLNKQEVLRSLQAGQTGIAPVRYLKTEHTEFPVGEVKLSDAEMESRLGIAPGTPTTRTSLMGRLALGEALQEASLLGTDLGKVGFVSGTTVGGMDKSEQYYLNFLEDDTRNEYIRTHDCGACSEMMADHFGRFGFVTTISTACSSAANAMVLASEMIESGQADIVVAGGSECISKFHLNGFNSLMILDRRPCRPFDAGRAGLNLGEGAAFLVLESEESARRRGVKALACLAGYGNACDAFHQTASSPDGEGSFLAMRQALEMAGCAPSEVDYVNAHGTGTPNNDLSESAAMFRLFGPQVPPVSSTKSYTGHTTSASGAIESVICLLALQHQFLPTNYGWTEGAEGLVRPVTDARPARPVRKILCNSFGFGGNDTSLLFTAPEVMPAVQAAAARPFEGVWVTSAKQVSLQAPLSEEWMEEPVRPDGEYVRATDPDFKAFLSPVEARRMGRLLKRALATSLSALRETGVEHPDAIVTGTGLGSVEDTELFLTALVREGEQFLKPTHFMQSTHNTTSSLIGIQTRSHGYNSTYSQKGTSFESALYDAWLQLRNGRISNALVGSHDEVSPSYYILLKKAGFVGQQQEICGEAAVSIMLQSAPAGHCLCRLAGLKMLYRPTDDEMQQALDDMLREAGLSRADVGAVMTGLNGQTRNDASYHEVLTALGLTQPVLRFKHLFGEGFSSSGLGFYAAAQCLAQGFIPAWLRTDGVDASLPAPSCLLVINVEESRHYSLVLLCGN